MNVLVTGGTGFVGRGVVQALRAAGHRVRVLARRPPERMDGVEFHAGSVVSGDGLAAACDGVEAVVHLVGIISEVGDQTYERVHVGGTRNLQRTAVAAGVGRWLQMSALGTRPDAVARYHRSKWDAEEVVRGGPIPWTVFRPSVVFGAGDGFIGLFDGMSRWSPVLPMVGGGGTRFQPVAVEDVALCLAAALGLPGTAGSCLDVCGPERLTLREIVESLLRVRGRRRLLVPVPWAVASVQGLVAEWVFAGLLGQAPPLNRDQVRMLREDNVGDPGPMERELGVRPRPLNMAVRLGADAGG